MPGSDPDPASSEPTRPGARRDEGELLDAARAVFAARGFEAASMEAIATGAGITKPTLYQRFDSKKALYEAAVQRDADALLAHLFAEYSKVAEGAVGVMVETSMRAYFDFFSEHPDAFGLLFASGRSEPAVVMADRVLATITDRLAEMVAAVLVRAGRPATPRARLLAAMLLGIAHHSVTVVRTDPSLTFADAQRLAASLALEGLRHLPAESLD